MGMLDELLRQLQEAAEQQRNQPLPGTPSPARPLQSAPTTFAKRARPPEPNKTQKVDDCRRGDDAAGPYWSIRTLNLKKGEDPVHRTVADSLPAVVESSRRREHPLMARLRQHGGMRDAVILAEILKRPRR